MDVLFLYLYRIFQKKRLFLFLLIIFVTGIAGFLASRIKLEEDITRMISGGNSSDVIGKVVEQSKFLEKIILSVSSSDTSSALSSDELISVGDELADTLNSKKFSKYIRAITYKTSDTIVESMFDAVYGNLPLFLDDKDYSNIDSLLNEKAIEKAINNDLKNLLSPVSFTVKQMIIRDPVGIGSVALKKLSSYQNDENYLIKDDCIFSRDLSHLMLFISPVYGTNETSRNSKFIDELRNSINELTIKNNGKVKIEYFGSVVIAVGNAERLKRDIRLTLTITIILLALIITFSVKKKKLFPFIFLPALFGGLMAVAVLYLLQGKVSVISLSIGSVILAITVDYALHITTHYKHKHSIINTIKDVSFPIIVCGFATAFEFLTLVFVSSESLKELGILASISVVTAAFFTMVVLPHILDATHSETDKTEEKNYLEKILDKVTLYAFEKNKMLLAFMLLFTFISLFYFKNVGFETDMMKMNYMSDELKQTENDLDRINNAKLNSVYIVAYGNNIQEALQSNENLVKTANSLKQQGLIKSFSSPGSLLMSDSLQNAKIEKWNNFWKGKDRKGFLNILNNKAENAGFRKGSFPEFTELINKEFELADSSFFKTLQKIFSIDNISITPDLASVITVIKVDNASKDSVIKKFENIEGVLVIDRKSVLSKIVNTLGEDFNFIANVSLLLILIVLIIAFGRIEMGFITFIPIFVSWIWTLGFMGIFGIKFNIFNIIISSFITGLGIDYSIYIMQGLVQGYQSNNRNLLSYKTCILISVLISVSGTGVLILAKHPALNSIALISIVGLLSVVLISYTFEPVLFNYLIFKNNKKRILPVTFSDIIITIFVFSLFIAGCIFMNIMLAVVIIFPITSKYKRNILHYGMMMWCKIPVYSMFHIKKKIVNIDNEDFKKPGLIISNHQSHIDLLLLLMLNPKLIVLTTKWVWNNPIYALVIRYLNYYPVMEGYGDITEKLRSKINEGYSIIVFPEGSRSSDSSITRFHKGAFLMAHQLNLDLIPVFIHGAGDCMNKGENHLRGGSITVKIYPRIKKSDELYGDDYHEMTKAMLNFYRLEYGLIKKELETPHYFRRKTIRNYIYKGPVLEWYTKIKLSLEGNYEFINNQIPLNASVTDIGCGYGYMSYILSFVSPKRKILGIDYDNDKIELAKNCISKSDNLNFVSADAASFEYANSDIFILSDVLHYLPEEKQDILLQKCMEKLNTNGKIIIRDADRDLEKRHRRTRYTEFFSTRYGFNKSENFNLYFFSGAKIRQFALKYDFKITEIVNSKITSNKMFILER